VNAREADSGVLSRDPVSGAAMSPREQPGYYPGYRTLGQQQFWDRTTRRVVIERVESPPALQYFNADEECFWTAVFAHLIPQTDRTQERQIPIVSSVDHRLATNPSIGYRFADMPPDREAYKRGSRAIDEESRAEAGVPFVELDFARADSVLGRIHDGVPRAAQDIWTSMSVHRFWQLLMRDAIDAYYVHPWAWDEIGFGGPAYPRAYTRLERGDPEPWEVEERRYTWAAPHAACSDVTENAHEFHTEAEQHRSHSAKAPHA
jgi:plasmid stabilization system protein ParE